MPSLARARFWMAWAGRDARRRWIQVVSIAVLIGLGTGMYASMSSMSRWRVASADASYAALRMHDLRVTLAEASYAPAGSLRRALEQVPATVHVRAAEERLVVPTQVDASVRGRSIIVPGRIVGAPLDAAVDRVAVPEGRSPDRDPGAVLIERNFAAHYDLPARGTVRLAGGAVVAYHGHAQAPEYFIVTAPGADFGAEASFGVVFTSLARAQRLAALPGRVNELVLRAPADRIGQLETELRAALRRSLPDIGVQFTRQQDEPAHRLIYNDAKNDQQMLNIFAFLLLGAAAFAAFNLVSRAIEAQRREIGIGMALGVRPRLLALRPLLLGVQIAVLGVAIGIPIALQANEWLGSVLRTWFPLPVLETPFEADLFATGAALGLGLPVLATAIPVWRAVRVQPVEAIRVGARAAKSSGIAWLAAGVHVPGGSLANMPVRNILRTPRRTALTALGIGAVVAIVVALAGVMNSFDRTLGAARSEALAGSAERLTVDFAAPQRAGADVLRAVGGAGPVGRAQPSLRLPVTLAAGSARFNAFMEAVPAEQPVWHPTLSEGKPFGVADGIVLARVAARDLGVAVGDRVSVRHPVPTAAGSFRLATTRVRVAGIHTSPFRFLTYVPEMVASSLGLGGLVNRVSVTPAAGSRPEDVKRALLGVPGVAAVQGASAATDAVDVRMAQFDDVLAVTVAVALAMAVLMAYNTSAINADERARENATMFAFGVPVGRVLRLGVAESLLAGLIATALGLAAGYGLLRWIVGSSMPETMPDVGTVLAISPATFMFALLAGTAAVALAPLLMRRRLERTDIPSTLRAVE